MDTEINEMKILIVDDNMKNIQVIGNILVEESYDFAYATSGQQALEYLDQGDFDLVLLDIMMPEMDGMEVCRQIRSRDRFSKLPIIFVTAKNELEDVVEGFHVGAQDYVMKPFQRAELLARVTTHLKLKMQQDKLNELNENLEEKITARTMELKDAYDQLSILDNAKRNFITLISHELRTPIHPIQMIATLLKEHVPSAEGRELIEMLNQSAERLERFAGAALRITQMQTGQLEPEMKNFDVMKQLLQIENFLGQDMRDKGLKLNYDILGSTEMFGDADLIAYALEGLIRNAVQYSPKEEAVKVLIAEAGGKTQILVQDRGEGFQDDVIRNFPEFFSSSSLSQREDQKLGLHLATAKLIMDMHRGNMYVYNDPEGGAVVELSLPKYGEI